MSYLLGECENIPHIMQAFDIAVSPSLWGEGFSNTIGEAMACGLPCVATDVGDSMWILSDLGKVVPPGDDQALAAACLELIGMDAEKRKDIGKKLRERIIKKFSLVAIGRQYDELYERVAS